MRNLIVAVTFSLVVLVFSEVVLADPADPEKEPSYAESADNSGMIAAPVTYKDTMLIAVTKEGVAAIAFGESVDLGRKYRFRFLPIDGGKEITGEGSVWETYVDGKYDGGKVTIKAGRVSIGWSNGGEERGWLYYEPEKTRIQIAKADRFDDYTSIVDGKKFEKLDLKRFLKQP